MTLTNKARKMLKDGWTLEVWQSGKGVYTAHFWRHGYSYAVTGHGKSAHSAIKKALS